MLGRVTRQTGMVVQPRTANLLSPIGRTLEALSHDPALLAWPFNALHTGSSSPMVPLLPSQTLGRLLAAAGECAPAGPSPGPGRPTWTCAGPALLLSPPSTCLS